MKTFVLFVFLCFCSISAYAGDPCQMMGQKNPHGMDIKVSSVSVADTMNFMVQTMETMPFTVKVGDTVWFHVCMMAKDGKMHSTQIKYQTDMGTFSYNISMQAPTAGVAQVGAPQALIAYPNPVINSLSINIPSLNENASLEIFSVSGSRVLAHDVSSSTPIQISVGNLSNGTYLVKLISKSGTIGETRIAICH